MIEIKRAKNSDAHILAELGRTTFTATFAKDNTKEDLDLYLDETFSVEKQLAEIEDARRIIEIAWSGDKAVGFMHLLNGAPDVSVTGSKPIEILRLYVDSHWHGKGAGAALMERCIQAAHDSGFQTLWLGVWERNFRAQAYYKKYGFTTVGQHIFRVGTDEQNDLIMLRPV